MPRARFASCIASYWLLFILAPTGALAYALWPDHGKVFAFGIIVFVLLISIGERGFRLWKRLWRIDSP